MRTTLASALFLAARLAGCSSDSTSDFDVLKAPGGDGMVIFVGLARPVLDQ